MIENSDKEGAGVPTEIGISQMEEADPQMASDEAIDPCTSAALSYYENLSSRSSPTIGLSFENLIYHLSTEAFRAQTKQQRIEELEQLVKMKQQRIEELEQQLVELQSQVTILQGGVCNNIFSVLNLFKVEAFRT